MFASRLPCTAFHAQNSVSSCGGATAQMILASIGGGVIKQETLLNLAHAGSTLDSGWRVAPDGLAKALAQHLPPGAPQTFEVIEGASEDETTRFICWAIRSTGVAPAALTKCKDDFSHWLIVTGYHLSAHPTSRDDTSYDIFGFYLHDPIAFVSPITPIAHHDADTCGSDHEIYGYPHRHITYDAWQRHFLRKVEKHGHWKGKWIAVGNTSPASDSCLKDVTKPTLTTRPEPGDRLEIIDPELAIEGAEGGLIENELLEEEVWRDARLEAFTEPPILVEPLNHPEDAFYLVPFVKEEQRTTLLIAVDAYTGFYEESIARPEGTTHVPSAATRSANGDLFPDPAQEQFVWTPCLEAPSRFLPFVIRDEPGQPRYLRIDGVRFDAITQVAGA